MQARGLKKSEMFQVSALRVYPVWNVHFAYIQSFLSNPLVGAPSHNRVDWIGDEMGWQDRRTAR